ncbi:TPA: hypothetical protein ACU8BO_002232 [Neisseria subflava]
MLEDKTVGIPNIAADLASINALRFISSNEIEPTQLIVPTWWSTKSITESWELKGLYIFLLLKVQLRCYETYCREDCFSDKYGFIDNTYPFLDIIGYLKSAIDNYQWII